jgi:hypothetical protein
MNNDEIWRKLLTLYDDLKSPDAFPAYRPLLAHYTSLSNLENILRNNEIWFSNPLVMNDLEEVRFGVVKGAELVKNSQPLVNSWETPARGKIFKDAFDSYYHEFENEHAFNTYVFCLSEHEQDDFDGPLSMWRGYGSNGNGAAIVFDTGEFEAIEPSPLVINRVHYGSTEERLKWLNDLIQRFVDIKKVLKLLDDQIYLSAYALFDRIKLYALFSKHSGFREEREWRVVYIPEWDHEKRFISMLSYAIGSKGAELKLKMKVAPIEGLSTREVSMEKIVKRIVLGPSVSSPLLAHAAILRMLERLSKASLKDRVRVSSIPFRPA